MDVKELQKRLSEIYIADQSMRRKESETGVYDEALDRKHATFAKEVIQSFQGWPIITQIGKEAVRHLWLIVQHADFDPSFQLECLELIRALPKNEVDQRDVAYLEDRVRVNSGKPQLYGSQFYVNEQGMYGPRPIDDIKNLNQRRASVGLGGFTEYDKLIRKLRSERKI